jgi:hypothetical protein
LRAAVLLASVFAGAVEAQWRDGQAPVVQPAPPPVAPAPPDVLTPFASAYQAAGRPRVILLWNRSVSDQAATASTQQRVLRDSGNVKKGGSSETTTGPAGSASLSESTRQHDRTIVETTGTIQSSDGPRPSRLPEREATMLERAFVNEMGRGGLRFTDRALAMRTTAASQHRGGGDPQLIETDALLKHGDLIMEVLLVEDRDSPLGYAFDVRTKEVRTGVALSTVYSRAIPWPKAAAAATWQAGANGYELRSPPPAPLTIPEIGQALARDVMVELRAAWRK